MQTDSLPAEIFRAYDIRGVAGRTLTADGVARIGWAIGRRVLATGGKSAVVGRDGRLSGPELSGALIRGFRAAGVDVIDIGVVPTPVVYFAIHHCAAGGGVAVTGSHNPPEYNGLKIVVGGVTLAGADIAALRDEALTADLAHTSGALEQRAVLDDYVTRIAGDVRLSRPLAIAADCGSGVTGVVARRLLEAVGARVTMLFEAVDGTFPHHHPDPAKPENLKDLIAAVASGGHDLGLAFDGDGDRVGVVTGTGRIIWPDRLLILLARDVLSRVPGATIIYDVKCSRTVPAAITAAGGTPLMWKTGHSIIKAKLKETGAALAGEMSGHIFFKERWYGFDDGLYTACRLLEYLSRQGESADAVFDAIPDTVTTPELHVPFAEGEHYAMMARLATAADFPGLAVSTLDGLRVDWPDGFALVRPSNTTPMLVLRFEGDDQAALERAKDAFRGLFRRVAPDLALPF